MPLLVDRASQVQISNIKCISIRVVIFCSFLKILSYLCLRLALLCPRSFFFFRPSDALCCTLRSIVALVRQSMLMHKGNGNIIIIISSSTSTTYGTAVRTTRMRCTVHERIRWKIRSFCCTQSDTITRNQMDTTINAAVSISVCVFFTLNRPFYPSTCGYQ